MLEKGLVQIYTGDGKGKTTAAFGLALRAACGGHKVLIYQFLKPSSLEMGECAALRNCEMNIKTESLDIPWDMSKSFSDNEKFCEVQAAIKEVLEKIADAAEKKVYDCIILDEIIFCLSKGLARLKHIKNIIERRNPCVEIVMTGRGATKELIKLADLVTEMKKIKHPFDKGIGARKGIEF